jgi:hypothetical protein
MLASRVSGAGRRGKERKKAYFPRYCCEVIRPVAGSLRQVPVGGGGVEMTETGKRDRGKKKLVLSGTDYRE